MPVMPTWSRAALRVSNLFCFVRMTTFVIFAPGFDARLVGGKSTVDRKDGETLRAEYAAAVNSSPDLLGLISWNEFSENSYVEPSQKFGTRYLDVLRELTADLIDQCLACFRVGFAAALPCFN